MDDGYSVLLDCQFGMPDIEEEVLGLFEFQQPLFGTGSNGLPECLGAFFNLAHSVALVLIKHKAGRADNAG